MSTTVKIPDRVKCERCKGSGKVIVDWNAFNQLSTPIGLSRFAAEEWQRNYHRAYGVCPLCRGSGKKHGAPAA